MINDSKTELIVFRSPQLRCDLSGLSVNIGKSQITQSLKVSHSIKFSTLMIILLLICRSTYFHIRKHWKN